MSEERARPFSAIDATTDRAVREVGDVETPDELVEGEDAAVERDELQHGHGQDGPLRAEVDLKVVAVAEAAQALLRGVRVDTDLRRAEVAGLLPPCGGRKGAADLGPKPHKPALARRAGPVVEDQLLVGLETALLVLVEEAVRERWRKAEGVRDVAEEAEHAACHGEGGGLVGEDDHDVRGSAEHLGDGYERAPEGVAEDNAEAEDERAKAALVRVRADDAEIVARVRPGDDECPSR
jgi:hypothetical protein